VKPPEREANLVFTRMLAGTLAFTPGRFALGPTLCAGRAEPLVGNG